MDHHGHHLTQGNTDAPMIDHSEHVHGSMEHMMSMAVSILRISVRHIPTLLLQNMNETEYLFPLTFPVPFWVH